MTDSTSANPNEFSSLAALRQAHVGLLQRHRAGQSDGLLDEVEDFVVRGSATGAVLDTEAERWEAQGVLDYWLAVLFRAHRNPSQGALQPFDPSRAPQLEDSSCPYRGLEAFREAQHGVFFGRRRVTTEMVRRLAAGRLLVVLGPSGSGKSSLVMAGLIPALKAGQVTASGATVASEGWHYLPPIVPGLHPLESLASVIAGPGATAEAQKPHADALAADPLYLTRHLDAQAKPAVIIIDQFEEVFTLCTDERERRRFVEGVLAATRSSGPPHRVVLTMRSDFESQLAVFPTEQDTFEAAQYRVPPFNAAELREIIEKPAALNGLKFDEGIVDRLVNDILGEPAGLPLLQFALLKLWERRDRNRVTLETYRSVGGPLKALERSAEELYGRLLAEEQVTARRILLRIVRPGNSLEVTSNRVLRESVHGSEPRDRVDRVLDKLIAAGLLRQTGPDPAHAQIEVAHEALLRNWPRLVEWLDDERVRLRRRFSLTAAAQQWAAHGKDPGGLLGGTILDEARTYDDLDAIEQQFIAASQDALQRDARQKKRAVQVLVVLLILVIGLAIVSWMFAMQERNQRRSVELALDEAQHQMSEVAAIRTRVAEQTAMLEAQRDKLSEFAKLESELAKYPSTKSPGFEKAPTKPISPPSKSGEPDVPVKTTPPPPSKTTPISSPFDELQIRASAEPTGASVANTTLPQYQFKIWVDGPRAELARIKSVQYEFTHPTFRDPIQRSEDPAARFEQGYRGWGCLSSVKVTMTPVDTRVPARTVDFDMCSAVKFSYKK